MSYRETYNYVLKMHEGLPEHYPHPETLNLDFVAEIMEMAADKELPLFYPTLAI